MFRQRKIDRTIEDRIICGLNSCRYALREPILLKIARSRFERLYSNPLENPFITVYIPTYNRGEILTRRAVPSVLVQTYKNFELVIVGDCCTDNTESLLSKIGDSRIRFYNLPKRERRYPPRVENHWFAGPVVPANKALELVQGKWIARIDDDDMWTEDHLESLLRFAQRDNYEFVSGQYISQRYGKKSMIDGVKVDGSYYNPHIKDDSTNKSPKIGGTSTWLYRSYLRFFKYNINCWRKKWNRVNDTDITVRIYKAGVRMGFLENVIGYVFPRPGEKTLGLDAYKIQEKQKLKHYGFKY